MERRLLKYIMTPAMIVTWLVGIVLMLQGRWFAAHWFRAKFVLVLAMTMLHGHVHPMGALFWPRPQPAPG